MDETHVNKHTIGLKITNAVYESGYEMLYDLCIYGYQLVPIRAYKVTWEFEQNFALKV